MYNPLIRFLKKNMFKPKFGNLLTKLRVSRRFQQAIYNSVWRGIRIRGPKYFNPPGKPPNIDFSISKNYICLTRSGGFKAFKKIINHLKPLNLLHRPFGSLQRESQRPCPPARTTSRMHERNDFPLGGPWGSQRTHQPQMHVCPRCIVHYNLSTHTFAKHVYMCMYGPCPVDPGKIALTTVSNI